MRTLIGRTPVVLARRWLALERVAHITLRRDAYADAPGPTVSLAIGERTTYRAGAWLLDEFDRPALGDSYPAWGGTAGLTLEAAGVTAADGPAGIAVHPRALPRDAWAAVVIGALAGAGAAVGVVLRATAPPGDPADAVQIRATPTETVIERLAAGVATALATVPTPWRPGEVLRVELAWHRVRVYREPILVVDLTDAGLALAGRHAGLLVARATVDDAAAVSAFVGGELRQEYLGAGLDLGDVQLVLGEPVTFDVTLSNVAPMGGAARFAALLRHGANQTGTYELDRGTVRICTAVHGGTAPLTTAVGVIDGPTLTEDTARLQCRGRDAFLTPRIVPGPVTYLPGPPPGGLTPLPIDPCAPSTPPVIEAGPVPPEPVDPAGPGEGVGPEAPGVPSVELAGAYLVDVVGPSHPSGAENGILPILDAEFLAALHEGLELPTDANEGAVPWGIQTACLQRGSVSVANNLGPGYTNYKTQAILFRHPTTMPGTRMTIAVRGVAPITCDIGGMGADWGLGPGGVGGIYDGGYGPVGRYQGQTTQSTESGSAFVPAAWTPAALDGDPQIVEYLVNFPTIAGLENLRQTGDDRPTILAVLTAVPTPAPGSALMSGVCNPAAGATAWPTWALYDVDIGAGRLFGIEWGVTEDPETHVLEPVDRDAPALLEVPAYPPSAWADSGLYAQVFIVRVWTPEP